MRSGRLAMEPAGVRQFPKTELLPALLSPAYLSSTMAVRSLISGRLLGPNRVTNTCIGAVCSNILTWQRWSGFLLPVNGAFVRPADWPPWHRLGKHLGSGRGVLLMESAGVISFKERDTFFISLVELLC